MRRTMPGVNYALSAAVDRLRELYSGIPESRRPDINGGRFQALEADIDARCGAGDRDGALRAIEAWEEHARAVLSSCAGAAGG
jgi:hypothetical protein